MMREWISVRDRLPDEPMEYIVMISGAVNSTTLLFDGVHWFDASECEVIYYKVTHWMPLPEAPKEDTK